MQDLTWLLVAPIVHPCALVVGEHAQCVCADLWLERRHFDRRHQAVTSEERNIPGYAGGEEYLVLLPHCEHVQVQERARDDLVEERITCLYLGPRSKGAAFGPLGICSACTFCRTRMGFELAGLAVAQFTLDF